MLIFGTEVLFTKSVYNDRGQTFFDQVCTQCGVFCFFLPIPPHRSSLGKACTFNSTEILSGGGLEPFLSCPSSMFGVSVKLEDPATFHL